jgi:hypothetical protein
MNWDHKSMTKWPNGKQPTRKASTVAKNKPCNNRGSVRSPVSHLRAVPFADMTVFAFY